MASMSYPLWQLMKESTIHVIIMCQYHLTNCHPRSLVVIFTHCEDTFCIFRSSGRLVCTDPMEIPSLAVISLEPNQQLSTIICSTHAIVLWVWLICGCRCFSLLSHNVKITVCSSFNSCIHEHFSHNTITACLNQLMMNSDGYYVMQGDKTDDYMLFFYTGCFHVKYWKCFAL